MLNIKNRIIRQHEKNRFNRFSYVCLQKLRLSAAPSRFQLCTQSSVLEIKLRLLQSGCTTPIEFNQKTNLYRGDHIQFFVIPELLSVLVFNPMRLDKPCAVRDIDTFTLQTSKPSQSTTPHHISHILYPQKDCRSYLHFLSFNNTSRYFFF